MSRPAAAARRGNAFQSLKGKGLYCSILLRPRLVLDLDKLSTLTAWVAVAASRAVEACCGLRPGIKWTNDLVLGGRKLCGILTELELEAETGEPSAVIAGIGINVGQTDGDFGPALSRVATSLEQELGSPVRRADLAVCGCGRWTTCTPPSRRRRPTIWRSTAPGALPPGTRST